MFTAVAKGRMLNLYITDRVTTGSVGLPVQFIFDEEWDDVGKTAVFVGSGHTVYMALDANDKCAIPGEVLTAAGGVLKVGVRGSKTGFVIPTIWAETTIYLGTSLTGASSAAPISESLADQVLRRLVNVENIIAALQAIIAGFSEDGAEWSSQAMIDALNNIGGLPAYPVGSYYMSENSTSPAVLFGGTWTRFPESGQPEQYLLPAGNTIAPGASSPIKSVTLARSHIPNFTGYFQLKCATGATSISNNQDGAMFTSSQMDSTSPYLSTASSSGKIQRMKLSFGGDANGNPVAFSVMGPYRAVYCWRRIA